MLFVGAAEVNALAQAALRQVAQWPWIEHPTFHLRGGRSTTELIAAPASLLGLDLPHSWVRCSVIAAEVCVLVYVRCTMKRTRQYRITQKLELLHEVTNGFFIPRFIVFLLV